VERLGAQFGFQANLQGKARVETSFALANNKTDFINVLMSQGIAVQSMIMEGLLCHV